MRILKYVLFIITIIIVGIFIFLYKLFNDVQIESKKKIINNTELVTKDTLVFKKISDPMSDKNYWEIINRTLTHDDKHSALSHELNKLRPEEIAKFDLKTRQFMQISYTSELWCAAYIINGGCSDDGFEYFRYWLILNGEDFFNMALKSPDDLVGVKKEFLDVFEDESLWQSAYHVFRKKTNSDINIHIDDAEFIKKYGTYPDMKLNWSEEDEESMRKICPKLVNKYL